MRHSLIGLTLGACIVLAGGAANEAVAAGPSPAVGRAHSGPASLRTVGRHAGLRQPGIGFGPGLGVSGPIGNAYRGQSRRGRGRGELFGFGYGWTGYGYPVGYGSGIGPDDAGGRRYGGDPVVSGGALGGPSALGIAAPPVQPPAVYVVGGTGRR